MEHFCALNISMIYIYIDIYVYVGRERERERERSIYGIYGSYDKHTCKYAW